MGAYLTQLDLENALGPENVLAIFDDQSTGAADPGAVESVIDRAETEVNSYLPPNYGDLVLPVTQASIPKSLKMCALDYAICFSWERHSEYARLYAKDCAARMTRATDRMERVRSAVQRLYDVVAEPKPKNGSGGLVTTDANPMVCGVGGDWGT